MAKTKKNRQGLTMHRHNTQTVGRLGGGQQIYGVPWYSLYYGIGFGGYGGYDGQGYGNGETDEQASTSTGGNVGAVGGDGSMGTV